jgi:glycosyltransferase involved in cell wall biosynthesis
VLQQTFEDYEIIVVDDGSTDDTREKLKEFEGQIQYIFQSNAGVSKARNEGIRRARGEWIGFLDSDDEWYPEKLRIQMNDLAEYADAVAHFANIDLVFPGRDTVDFFTHSKLTGEVGERQCVSRPFSLILRHFIFLSGVLVRRSVLKGAPPFNERINIFEDYGLGLRVAVRGPWVFNSTACGAVIRREEEILSLIETYREDPTGRFRCQVEALREVRFGPDFADLDSDEKRFLSASMASALQSLGLEYALAGNRREARRTLMRAARHEISLRWLVKYLMLLVPGSLGTELIRKRPRRRRVHVQ